MTPLTKEPITLVHGFTQTGQSWRVIADALSANYTVTTLDLPGHGASSDRPVADISEAAARVGEVGGRSTYIGYSMGGRICLRLALNFPHLIDRLILVGATPGIIDADERLSRQRADDALAESLDPTTPEVERLLLSDFFERWLEQPMFSDLGPSQQDLESRRHNTAKGLASALRSLGTGTQEPIYQRLSEITAPTLLVAGDKDEKFSEIAFSMAKAIGENATVQLIEDAGHGAPFSQPDRFLRVIESFLADHPAA